MVVANEAHRFIVNRQAEENAVELGDFFLEPIGRNTAPAILIAAMRAYASNPKALLLFLPSDHVILDTPGFHKAVQKAAEVAANGRLCCFGITPSRAETGYGYILAGDALAAGKGAYTVQAFKEKPDAETAEAYLKAGTYTWNSGMFLFRADVLMHEMKRFAPAMVAACEKVLAATVKDLNFERFSEDLFKAVPADSIDYALLEKTDLAAVVPADIGWSDVGSFSSLWHHSEQDTEGNAHSGDAIFVDTKNTYVRSGGKLVATVGVEDLIIVATDDAVLVADKHSDQDVKKVVDVLKAQDRQEVQEHSTVYRPWGSYKSIAIGPRFQVKEIMVYPGKRLSLQMHHHRAEHWVIVEGEAVVTRDTEEFTLGEDESVYLPVGTKHRLENKGDVPLRLVEVQTGSYLGEDDIVRFEDDFNRS
ncbi:xanthan biosynthesis protein XanB [Kordiimonas sediminis]|uniref:mannose-1-phosphate guanylyltransferase n=2 Tax=Kordiimonas sediminis TaxID=1735581 RepID=A0A919E6E0_9PROT|nr:xanthan biosynthesis protein XanB [Kordiimonas sediminis]